MTVLNDVLLAVIALSQDYSTLGKITIGALPADESVVMVYSTGAPAATALDKGQAYEMPCVLNGKSRDQKKLSDCLNAIHAALSKRREYPRSDEWQITDVEVIAAPAYLDREDNGQWLYGSSLRIKFYYF